MPITYIDGELQEDELTDLERIGMGLEARPCVVSPAAVAAAREALSNGADPSEVFASFLAALQAEI